MRAALVVFVAYLVTAKIGLEFSPRNPAASPVWPASGMALAAALLLGWRCVLPLWAASFLANVTNAHTPVSSSALIASGITVAALVAALVFTALVTRAVGPARDLPGAYPALAGAAVLSSIIASSVGVDALWVGGVLGPGEALDVRHTWLLGDLAGMLVVTPAILLSSLRARWTP